MKRILKFCSAALLAVMAVTMAAPAMKSYAAKEFTYAEQASKKQVTQLEMKDGEQTDLCFIGAPDYKKYTCKWESSNEDVAVVDNKGVITAKAQGVAEITLLLGDGKAYTSTPVTVTVVNMDLTVGNSGNKAMNLVELKKGEAVDLNFYGITDWSSRKNVYLTEWFSSDTEVASVDYANGVVTAVSEGTSVVIFYIYDMEKDVLLSSAPVTVIVTE